MKNKKPKRPLKTTPLDKMIESLCKKRDMVQEWRFDDTVPEQDEAVMRTVKALTTAIFALRAFKAFDK